MKQFTFSLLVATLCILTSCTETKTNVACVGDSITEGATIYWESSESYPVILGNLLGHSYNVTNCGRSATTLQKEGDFPYWRCKDFHNVFASKPNIIVVKLGTNDTKPYNWNAERFASSYQALIDTFQTITPQPKIYLCLPVPVYETKWGINDSTVVNGVIPAIKAMAEKNKLAIIDLYSALSNQPELFPDKIHPNEAGAKIMAETVAKAIR
jgi:acyl-CoA thioesterase I